MDDNIFLEGRGEMDLRDYMDYSQGARQNMGSEVPVQIYRLLEYSMREELKEQFGKEKQIELFRNAGRRAGKYFADKLLDMTLPLGAFVAHLQKKLEEYRVGVLRVEDFDESTGRVVLTVAEDANCSGLPLLGEAVCNYDEGFLAGILSRYTGKEYTATEIDCWAMGDRVCRFCASPMEE